MELTFRNIPQKDIASVLNEQVLPYMRSLRIGGKFEDALIQIKSVADVCENTNSEEDLHRAMLCNETRQALSAILKIFQVGYPEDFHICPYTAGKVYETIHQVWGRGMPRIGDEWGDLEVMAAVDDYIHSRCLEVEMARLKKNPQDALKRLSKGMKTRAPKISRRMAR
jgi:hypothetical protein